MKRFHLIGLLFLLVLCGCQIQREPGQDRSIRDKILQLAEHLQGLPYHFGGVDIDGFDCSGLVQYVYDCFGIKIPRSAKSQACLKKKINLKRAKPADILIFRIRGRWHTAIYTGANSFIHAPKRNCPIRKEQLNTYWKRKLEGAIQLIRD